MGASLSLFEIGTIRAYPSHLVFPHSLTNHPHLCTADDSDSHHRQRTPKSSGGVTLRISSPAIRWSLLRRGSLYAIKIILIKISAVVGLAGYSQEPAVWKECWVRKTS